MAVLVAVMLSVPSAALADQTGRLVDQLAREARLVLEIEPLTIEALGLAGLLTEQALELAPDDEDLWRLRLDLAEIAEQPEVVARAVDRICRLDPADEVMRLRRVRATIGERQTVEERIALFEILLAEDRRDTLGSAAVASRLALELALLHRRRGDTDAFARWLGESVALDPGHRAAAAVAAGYFRATLDDPYEQAELLMNLVLTDPADLNAQVDLAHLLLDNASYRAAAHLLQQATRPRPLGGVEPASDLFADLMIAEWASGRAPEALRIAARLQQVADTQLRRESFETMPDLTPTERASLTATLSPAIAAARAAIMRRTRAPEGPAAVRELERAFAAAIEAVEDDPAEKASLLLQQASTLVWLGGNIDTATSLVEQAAAIQPLSDVARDRFDGWAALRRGEVDEAEALLAPHAEVDRAAQAGMGMVNLARSRRSDAARHLLQAARDQPGSLLGVWCADLLFELLGQRLPLSDQAQRLDTLIASVPEVFDRYLTDPSLTLGLRIEPDRPTYGPFEKLRLEAVVTNNGLYPLSIDPDGPLRPTLAVVPSARIVRESGDAEQPAIIIDIDRRLTLQPSQSVRVPLDLRRFDLGRRLDGRPLRGALLRVRAVVNFATAIDGSVEPANLGTEAESQAFRVNGVEVTRSWIESSLSALVDPVQAPDVKLMACLSHASTPERTAAMEPEERRLFSDAMDAVAAAYARLEPADQAWLLSVLRPGPSIEPILAIARKSEDRLVKMAYLIWAVEGPDDPMLDAARRDDDVRLRTLADLLGPLLEQRGTPATDR